MKIPEVDPALRVAAVEGDIVAIDGILQAIRSGVFNLAVRMLGNREDAADATQENPAQGGDDEAVACRCERQLPALRRVAATSRPGRTIPLAPIGPRESSEAERQFGALVRMSDAAALFRAHPEYLAPATMIEGIRAVLSAEGYWRGPNQGRSLQ